MSEIKHTPGPWILDDAPNHADVIANDYHFIDAGAGCTGMSKPGFGIAGCMSLADARLIAAAPELLEALQEILLDAVILSADYLETFRDWPDDKVIQGWDKARWKRALAASQKAKAAIAKATGAQS